MVKLLHNIRFYVYDLDLLEKICNLQPFAKKYAYNFVDKYAKEDLRNHLFKITDLESYAEKEETKKLERRVR